MKHILNYHFRHFPHLLTDVYAGSGGNFKYSKSNRLIHIYGYFVFLRLWFGSLNKKHLAIFGSALAVLPIVAASFLFLTPKTIQLSLSEKNCFFQPMIFPGTVNRSNSDDFILNSQNSLSIGNTPIFSSSTCVDVYGLPHEQTSQSLKLSALGGIMNKKIEVKVASLPAASKIFDAQNPISQADGLEFKLNSLDKVFSYNLQIQDQTAICRLDDLNLNCAIDKLALEQGKSYDFSLKRTFHADQSTILESSFLLRDPVLVTEASIQQNQIIYDIPKSIQIEFNKPIDESDKISLKTNDGAEIAFSTSQKDSELNILFDKPLPRKTQFVFTLGSAVATDGAYLSSPFTVEFTTSGGPEVSGVNIGSFKVSESSNIIINFDSELSAAQNIKEFVSLRSGNIELPFAYTVSGNSLNINPANNLPRCTSFAVSVKDGLSNVYGVSGSDNWTYNSRTICQRVSSIGTSVQGRSITSYSFGNGPILVLFVGGTHGNERSSYRTLIAWVDELERGSDKIPANKTVVVIPDLNPDGYVHQTRTNANGVDLNRNFPSNDWASAVYMPGGLYRENGGGSSPLSEPESMALANFVNSNKPSLVLTYHATASVVFANGSGNSASLASLYASRSGFSGKSSGGEEDQIFGYPTTGEFEAWLHDKKSIAGLLVELATLNGNEINSQKSAMWAMLQN